MVALCRTLSTCHYPICPSLLYVHSIIQYISHIASAASIPPRPHVQDKAHATALVRLACMTLRNGTARSSSVRAALLQRGAEALLRGVLAATALGVPTREAASACLRDMGLEGYQLEASK